MGNSIKKAFGSCFPFPTDEPSANSSRFPHGNHSRLASAKEAVGHALLARDLLHFEATGQVPRALQMSVDASIDALIKWFKILLKAWKKSIPPPSNAVEASLLVAQNVEGLSRPDIETILSLYGLPALSSSSPAVIDTEIQSWQKRVQYEMETILADSYAAVDGDSLVVYVDVDNDPQQEEIPRHVQEAVEGRRDARQRHDYKKADALQKQIKRAGYKVVDSKNGRDEIIARKYRIRLRGVDAPENSMPYGRESKAMLKKIVSGKPLRLRVYDVDQYGRLVADVHCSEGFVQEILLKNGGAWHYSTYDKREEFAKWELNARKRRLGLWQDDNPEKPWDYRKKHNRDGTPKF